MTWFAAIPTSHFADGDGSLVHASAIAGYDHVSVAHAYAELAARYEAHNPGWFPLAPLPLAAWLIDTVVSPVKLLQYLLVVLTFGLFAEVARRLFDSTEASIVAVVLALCAWQFRMPHDPVAGTSLLVPWLADLVLLSFAGWLGFRDTGKPGWLIAAFAALALALLSGPVAWGLGALLVVMAFASRRSPAASVGFLVLLLAAIVISSKQGLPIGPWRHAGGYAQNVIAQLFAALPTSFRAFGYLPIGHVPALYHGTKYVDDRFILVPAISLLGWLAVVSSAALGFVAIWLGERGSPARSFLQAVLFGVGFWVVSALSLGPTDIWKQGLPIGQAFDNVYFEYLGFAVLATAAVFAIRRTSGLAGRLVPAFVTLIVFIACYGNARTDALVLERSVRLDAPRSAIQRAGAEGFFRVIPDGSVIAISPALPFADGIDGQTADAKYALYHYSGRRFGVVSIADLHDVDRGRSVWILRTSQPSGVLVSLSRWAGGSAGVLLTDRAYGFTVSKDAAAEAVGVKRGIISTITALPTGVLIDARRTCGPVPLDSAFVQSRPSLVYGDGFFAQGPHGYELPPPKLTPLGDIAIYPKMFMTTRATLSIYPPACTTGPSPVTFNAIVVAGAPSTLTIYSPNHIDHVAASTAVTPLSLRFVVWKSPIRLVFRTDAPPADLDPIVFRYERDVPRDLRLVIEPSDVRQDP